MQPVTRQGLLAGTAGMDESSRPSRGGFAVLDIGGGLGALVVHAPPAMLGAEPELTALEDGTRVHSSVRERVVQGDVTYAALYPCLAAGCYRLDGTGQVVTVVSGEVTEVSWPVS